MEVINKQAKELVSRNDVKDTPFTIISLLDKNEHFAVLGEYRITEKYDKAIKAEAEVIRITWNRVIQVMLILNKKINLNEIKTGLESK